MNIKNPFNDEYTSPQLSPLIDVLFLLLVFFMLTSTFNAKKAEIEEQEIAVQLPIATQSNSVTPHNSAIKITIKRDGHYEVDGVFCEKLQLPDVLQKKARQNNKIVMIFGDKNAPFQAVVYVYDVIQALGIQKFSHKVLTQNE